VKRRTDTRGFVRGRLLGALFCLAAALVLWGCSGRTADPPAQLSFAAINDIHVTDQASTALVRQAAQQINADARVRFVLLLGDLTQDSSEQQMALAEEALRDLRCPLFALPGNHDAAPGVFERHFGPRSKIVAQGRWHFLLLDCGPDLEPTVGPEQRRWLQERLAKIPPDQPVVLCTHQPLAPHIKMFRVKNADAVLSDFAGRRLVAVISGHFHGNWTETANGVLFANTVCLSTTRANHDGSPEKGFRLFHCRGDAISTEFVRVE
jgi:3',5'-cyclic AMP phosphodiesterase CpdA